VARYPRAVLLGLFLQTGVLPWAAFALALLLRGGRSPASASSGLGARPYPRGATSVPPGPDD